MRGKRTVEKGHFVLVEVPVSIWKTFAGRCDGELRKYRPVVRALIEAYGARKIELPKPDEASKPQEAA
jgi:hypothetical protein